MGTQKYLLCIRNIVNSTYHLQHFHDMLPKSREPSHYKSNAELRLLLQAHVKGVSTSDRRLLCLGTKRAKQNHPSPGVLEAVHTRPQSVWRVCEWFFQDTNGPVVLAKLGFSPVCQHSQENRKPTFGRKRGRRFPFNQFVFQVSRYFLQNRQHFPQEKHKKGTYK